MYSVIDAITFILTCRIQLLNNIWATRVSQAFLELIVFIFQKKHPTKLSGLGDSFYIYLEHHNFIHWNGTHPKIFALLNDGGKTNIKTGEAGDGESDIVLNKTCSDNIKRK